jgi:aminopeptidase-like protein
LADRAAELVLKQTEDDFIIEDFFPYGSDERQYCSPGFNLPVGSLMRTRYGKYWQYHTSADNKSFISFEAMEKSVQKYLDIVELIEENKTYLNKSPFCEPKLSSRGIQFSSEADLNAALWLLNLTDGDHDLIDISNRSNLNYRKLISIAHLLKEKDLIL